MPFVAALGALAKAGLAKKAVGVVGSIAGKLGAKPLGTAASVATSIGLGAVGAKLAGGRSGRRRRRRGITQRDIQGLLMAKMLLGGQRSPGFQMVALKKASRF